jgi:orotate phosphoribosyltransferase
MENKMKDELAKVIYQTAYLTGTFTLRSGQVSGEYFDKYLFEADPYLLAQIAERMADLIPDGTEILAGLEMGGIPVATALSMATGLPAAFVRKKAKDYGTCKLAEGSGAAGKRVCIIEDVVTTGGQVILSARDLRAAGAIVEHVLCVIERDPEAGDKLAADGLKLRALFTMAELTQGMA